MVVISASGMAESGRILHHLKNNIENPLTTVCIVSWQAPDTLGRRLAEHQKNVKIFGEPYDVRAEVVTIGGLSSHAGQDFLMEYALAANGKLRKVFLVHGEEKPAILELIKAMILNKSSKKGIILTDHDYRNVLDIANKYYLLFDGGLKSVKTKQDLIDWGYVPDRQL